MAFEYEFSGGSPISLDEYMAWVDQNVDTSDPESIKESAVMLYRLSQNRSLLEDFLVDEIRSTNGVGLQSSNAYTDMTFMLGSSKGYFVRANVWMPAKPPKGAASVEQLQDELYAYEYPHDHNFDLLTVGYWGPGYRTEIFEYDPTKVVGYVGEKVDLEKIQDTYLSEGKVMFFRKSEDIHIQHHPEALSISVNLLPVTKDLTYRPQYGFDIASKTISGYVEGGTVGRVRLIEMAVAILGERASGFLEEIGKSHRCARTRMESFDALAKGSNDPGAVYERAMSDSSAFVRHMASQALARI